MATTLGNFQFLESYELQEVLQNLIAPDKLTDPLFTDIMTIDSTMASKLVWQQRDNFPGLTNYRGNFDGPFGVVSREGISEFTVLPGPYGDEKPMSGEFLARSAEIGTPGTPMDISEAQGSDVRHLLGRAINRIRKIGWDLVTTGNYQVTNAQGGTVLLNQFNLTPFNVAVAWTNFSTATPLLDLRNAKLRHRGQSASFGRKAKLYINSQDVNSLLSNTNPNDLGAKRVITVGAGAQPMTLTDVNRYLLEADLPQIVEYDEGYLDNTGTFNVFIAQGQGVLVGARDMGDPVAKWWFTRNTNMEQGVRNQVKDRGGVGEINVRTIVNPYDTNIIPRTVVDFNGAPAIYFPSAVIPFRGM